MIMDTYGWLSGCFDVVDFRDVVHTAWPPNVRCHLTKCRYGGALSVWVTKIRFCHSRLVWPQMADLGTLGHSVIKKHKNLSVKTVMNRCTWLQMIVMIMSGLCMLRWDESHKPQSTLFVRPFSTSVSKRRSLMFVNARFCCPRTTWTHTGVATDAEDARDRN